MCDAASAQNVNTTQLYNICRSDPVCAPRFYLKTSAASSYGHQLFERLLGLHLSNIGGADSLPPISDPVSSDAWWLALLRTARFCDGKANQEFQLGVGCKTIAGRHDGDVDAGKFTWEFVAVDIMVVFAVLIVVYYTYSASEQLSSTRRSLSDFRMEYAPPPPQQPLTIPVTYPSHNQINIISMPTSV